VVGFEGGARAGGRVAAPLITPDHGRTWLGSTASCAGARRAQLLPPSCCGLGAGLASPKGGGEARMALLCYGPTGVYVTVGELAGRVPRFSVRGGRVASRRSPARSAWSPMRTCAKVAAEPGGQPNCSTPTGRVTRSPRSRTHAGGFTHHRHLARGLPRRGIRRRTPGPDLRR